jgi:RHH-type proline utilization regulon transcriptional repressor/proline dehydrogenase/delta 1-pyrroline-5-carboxylate dehydrogenase
MDDSTAARLETAILEIGATLHAEALRSRPQLFQARGLRGAILAKALGDESLRRALFQFIDVLPELGGSTAIARHFSA